MGSWYNLEGEALMNCINDKCGQRPSPPSRLTLTPQKQAEYESRLDDWNKCKENCKSSRFVQSVPYTSVPRRPNESTLSIGKKPNEEGAIINTESPSSLINTKTIIIVGVVAVAAYFLLRK